MDRFRWLAASLAIVFVAVLGAMGSARGAAAAEPAPAAERPVPIVAEPPAPAEPPVADAEPPTANAEPPETAEPLATASAPFQLELDEEDEGEEDGEGIDGELEDEADECEFADEAREEACEEEVEEREVAAEEAEECRLESAEATVAAVPGRDRLRLSVRYRTFEPSAVAIDLGLRGGKGPLDLGSEDARFGRSGTLHTTETLTDEQMARAMAAKEFTVDVQALNTPGFCGKLFERHLSARKGAGGGIQWSDPTAGRRAKASRL